MSNIFLTSDLHLGHKNIIRYCNRPFKDVYEMDETIIDNWNHVVNKNDSVYIIGDFAMKDPIIYLDRLNGHKFLIPGNHDTRLKSFSTKGTVLKLIHKLRTDPRIILCHYAMRVWEHSHYGSYHAFGHSHGMLKAIGKSMDVGVDCNDFIPVLVDEFNRKMESREENYNWVADLPGIVQ